MIEQGYYKVKDGQKYSYCIDYTDTRINFVEIFDPKSKTVLVFDKKVGLKAVGSNALEVLSYIWQKYNCGQQNATYVPSENITILVEDTNKK